MNSTRQLCRSVSLFWVGLLVLGFGCAPGHGNEKESRTAAQKKLDSHIVLALKKERGEPPFDKPTKLDPDLVVQADGRVLVDINATVTPGLLDRITKSGGGVINNFEAAHAIRALVPLDGLEALASREDVRFIAPAAQATTNSGGAASGGSVKP